MKYFMGLVSILTLFCAAPGVRAAGEVPSAGTAAYQLLVTFTDRSINRASIGGPGDYYTGVYDTGDVGYQSTAWGRRISHALAQDYQLRTVTGWPIASLGIHCVVYEIRDGRPVERVLEELARDHRVGAAQRMNTFRVLSDDPYRELQKSLPALSVDAAHRYATGRQVTIAVIDTGVDLAHPDLAGQITVFENLVAANNATFDEDIHGTAIVGIIAALANNGLGIEGVAPDAKLIALKACWPESPGAEAAICNSLTLAKALDSTLRLAPQILNLSLAGPRDPLLEALLRAAFERHIIIVAAEPAQRSADTEFPTSFSEVIRARSASTRPESAIASGITALAAPGVDVLTTFPHGTYNFISGSSFAAAHISGLVALLLELQPELTGTQVHDILVSSAGPASMADGASLLTVNACAAIQKLRSVSCVPEAQGTTQLSGSTPSLSRELVSPAARREPGAAGVM